MSGFSLTINPDGADCQSQAVLAYLRGAVSDGIEASWDDKSSSYKADVRVVRYDNCREQGYIVFLRDAQYKNQINIAFYEHRNSDSICAVMNNKRTFNAPVLNDITETLADKYDVSYTVNYGQAADIATWIADQLKQFWADSNKV